MQAVANDLFLKLLDLWLDNVDCIGHNVQSPLRQKVWALALCRTLGAKHPGIVERIPLVLNAVASVLMDSRSQVRFADMFLLHALAICAGPKAMNVVSCMHRLQPPLT